jgi:dUTP pyrophosphatase
MIPVRIQLLSPQAKTPGYAYPGDAGMDVFANETVTLAPGERHAVGTGFATEFPSDYVALVWDRSSMAVKKGIKTMAGVVDSGYRGEWKVVLINLSEAPVTIETGDKIAQAIFQRFETAAIEVVESLDDSSRGTAGFGSTGG